MVVAAQAACGFWGWLQGRWLGSGGWICYPPLVLVREGAALASALGRHKRLPAMLAMFARLGEQTGQLPRMRQRVSAQLGNDVQRRAMQLATILEPLLIVTMGLVVKLIVLAVMLPIIQLNQLVR